MGSYNEKHENGNATGRWRFPKDILSHPDSYRMVARFAPHGTTARHLSGLDKASFPMRPRLPGVADGIRPPFLQQETGLRTLEGVVWRGLFSANFHDNCKPPQEHRTTRRKHQVRQKGKLFRSCPPSGGWPGRCGQPPCGSCVPATSA